MTRRLLLSYLSITLLGLIALGLPLGVSYANGEHRRTEADLRRDASVLVTRAGAFFDGAIDLDRLQQVVDNAATGGRTRVVVVDRGGGVVATSGGAAVSAIPRISLALEGHEVVDAYTVPGLGRVTGFATPVRSGASVSGAVLVEVSRQASAARIRDNWLLLFVLCAAILLVVGLVSTLLARSFTKPIDALDRGAARLGEGDLATRVDVPDDPPELARLARSFNATAERLDGLVRSQQEFVADASHQLRTPLAALRLRLENLEAETTEGGHADDVARSLAEVQRLSQLVDGLLVLTRADADRRATEPVDLGQVLADRRTAWSALASERGVEIRLDGHGVRVRSVPGRLEQVLDNLLSNALEVAPSGSAIRVGVTTVGCWAVVSVCDAGPGIPPEQRTRAFDRFWRSGTARRDGGGFGLGLPIVRRLVTADGGDVSLGDAPEGGLAVTLRLPLAGAGGPQPRPEVDVSPPTAASRHAVAR